MFRYFIGIFLILASTLLQAAIWENNNQWDEQWEEAYSQWVETNFTSDIYMTGKYQGIRHDCSDSVYFARLLFAYENKLPFVIRDPDYTGENSQRSQTFDSALKGDSDNPYDVITEFISNDMTFYDDLEPHERLLRFIEFVGYVTWTESLVNDTYPVQLNRQWFRPGIVAVLPRRTLFSPGDFDILNPDNNYGLGEQQLESTTAGHAQLVTRIDDTGVIHYLKSTIPAKLQSLRPTTLNSFVPGPEGGSFRRWKQPHQYGLPEGSLPGYGVEQFDLHGIFEDVMQRRLALVNESTPDKIQRLANEVCAQLQQRIPIVEQSWAYKQQIAPRCMNFDEYDLHSTPSRDAKIKKTLKYLLYSATGNENSPVTGLAEQLDHTCGHLRLENGTSLVASKFARQVLDKSTALSDPNQPPAVRWGLQPPESNNCKQYY